MGKFEKLVVLLVLFLSAVVLAVSNGKSEEAGMSPTDLGRAGEVHASDEAVPAIPARAPKSTRRNIVPAATSPRASTPKAAASSSSTARLLLDAGGPAQSEQPRARGQILTTTAGLRPSLVADFMQYTVRDGDTWVGLAKRFYSDARQAANLRVANDDPQSLRAGMGILVPVFDHTREAGQRDAFVPAAMVAQPSAGSVPAPTSEKPAVVVAPRAGTTYVVQEGDNLSRISKKVYGTSTQWQAIYAANRDVMKSADWLTVGMKLSIPESGKAPKKAAASGSRVR